MKISDAVGVMSAGSIIGLDLEEIYKRRKEAAITANEEEAMQKVEEAKQANSQTTFKMMDRHNEMVKKSQELSKAKAKKRMEERLAKKQVEEHSEVLAEMAIRNAERRCLLEAARLEKQSDRKGG